MKRALKFQFIEGGSNPAYEYVKISSNGYIYTTNGLVGIKASIEDSCGSSELVDALKYLAKINNNVYIRNSDWHELSKSVVKVKAIKPIPYYIYKQRMYVKVGHTPKRITVFLDTEMLGFSEFPEIDDIIQSVENADAADSNNTFYLRTECIKAIRKCLEPIAKNITLKSTITHNYIKYTVPNYDITIITRT